MKRLIGLLAVGSLLSTSGYSQLKKKSFDPALLQASWQATPQQIDRENRSLTELTFFNNSRKDMPAAGWKIYFNFASSVDSIPPQSQAIIEHVNGDLFCIVPKKNFTGLKPKGKLIVAFYPSDAVVNFTDAPNGLYYVAETTQNATAINDYTILPLNASSAYLAAHHYMTPQTLYRQNQGTTDLSGSGLIKIFPTPVSYKETGGNFDLTAAVGIISDEKFKNEAAYLSAKLESLLGKKMAAPVSYDSDMIVLRADTLPADAYRLEITGTKITIDASTPSGMFYGIESLISLIPSGSFGTISKDILIPRVAVEDAPRFAYRSFMLDVARNFEPKAEILKLLDLMALYKLNIFHLHFSDDEGWRIEMPSLPELTSFGSLRGYSPGYKNLLPPSHGSGPDTTNHSGSGYYTRKDFIDILKYANQRHISVIPEIESPGHARAAIQAMNQRYYRLMKEGNRTGAEEYLLHDMGDSSQYESVQLWKDNVMDVSLPSTYNFVNRVVSDLQQMYQDAGAPLLTIHMGGDEVPAGVWQESPAYLKLRESDPEIKNTNDLWYYYYGKVDSILNRHHLFLTAWEEAGLRKTILDGKNYSLPNPDFVNRNFHLIVWNNTIGDGNEDLAYKLANSGYKVVLSCVSNNYFDMAYYKDYKEPGYYWGGYEDVDKPFYFIPYDYFKNVKQDKEGVPVDKRIFAGKQRLTDYGKSNIEGLTGALWGENIISTDRLEYMLLPKLLGLAQRAWAKDPEWATLQDSAACEKSYQTDWNSFINIVGKRELPRLDNYDGGYHYRIPMPGAAVVNGSVLANLQIPGFEIRYTTDGSEPSLASNLYTGPVRAKGVVKFRAFNSKGRGGNTAVIDNN